MTRLSNSIRLLYQVVAGVFVGIGALLIGFQRSPYVSFDVMLVLSEVVLLLSVFMINKKINGLEKFLRSTLFLTHLLNAVVFVALRFLWFIRIKSTCTRC